MKRTNLKQKTSKIFSVNRCLLRRLICVTFAFVLVSGCGYSQKSLISRKINSIYIPIFQNGTFRRGLEFELTKAVKDEIMSRTSLRIIQKESADTILFGNIREVKEAALTQRKDNIVEGQVRIYADITLLDRRTDRVISKGGFSGAAEYIVSRGENLQSGTEEGIANLARLIVNNLEEEW
ncbi:MAG: LPS assembly lipoprotein LptE [Candidatus Scalindua sp.]